MGSFSLQADHFCGELFGPDSIALKLVAYGIVLAEDASEITAGKKHSAGPPVAGNRRFFAMMKGYAGNQQVFARTTYPFFVRKPVNPAISGTYPAPAHHVERGRQVSIDDLYFFIDVHELFPIIYCLRQSTVLHEVQH